MAFYQKIRQIESILSHPPFGMERKAVTPAKGESRNGGTAPLQEILVRPFCCGGAGREMIRDCEPTLP